MLVLGGMHQHIPVVSGPRITIHFLNHLHPVGNTAIIDHCSKICQVQRMAFGQTLKRNS